MKNNPKCYKPVFLHAVFILVCMLIFSLIGASSVLAEDDDGSEEDGGDSGGFTIESDRVEGAMDVAGALGGKIDIKEGIIEGLTITKTLDRGEEEGLVIKITSPGPIDVKNLKAHTIDGGPPHFDGLCVSEKLGWACLEGVEMTVPQQSADNISLPDAKVETCFESECGGASPETSMSEQEMANTLKKMDEQDMTLKEMTEGLEDDKEKLQTIEELIKQAEKHFEKIQDNEYTNHLQQLTDVSNKHLTADMTEEELIQFMEENLDLNSNTSEGEEANTDSDSDDSVSPLVPLTHEIEKTYKSYDDVTAEFFSAAQEAAGLVKELEESIQMKEKSLAALEAEKDKLDPEKQKQAENYNELKDKAETGEAGNDKETNHDEQADSDSKKNSDEKNEDLTIDAFKKEFKTFKENMDSVMKRHDELQENVKSITEKKEAITDNIKDLKAVIMEFEDDYSDDIYQNLMETLSFVEVEKGQKPEGKGENDDTGNKKSSEEKKRNEDQNTDEDSDSSDEQNGDAASASQDGKQESKKNNDGSEQTNGNNGNDGSKQESEADP
ncbi:hypothetical protein [Lentibacillus salicampi]|uniref:DUF5667 domain-containing protein n=1 Tax=Lentibacillus salicampi TaxID=175306 RepID=A0A4Y9AEF6_9BACI|nr:hypothetical protein [Lentibacillus salicampi]TFJ94269.1 hypothetical protein E4U82_03160 [Lentibacillus salicampi]